MFEDFTMELAKLERETLDALRARMSAQQLGTAFEGLEECATAQPTLPNKTH